MMAAIRVSAGLIERLPRVRGRYAANVPLAGMTWFRAGGPAEVLFRPADHDDLVHFLRERPTDVPVTMIGVGSNLLIRDGGVPGVVIRLGKAFSKISIDGELVTAGAGIADVTVAFAARDSGIAGLEFLRGIPGTMGGALAMNAGAYGREIADILVAATAVDPAGTVHDLTVRDMGFGYRCSSVDPGWIFISATLRGSTGDKAEIARRIEEINQAREMSQPLRTRTGGSTFKNPVGVKAWQLIDAAGCRGMRRGGAEVSSKHCNFLINIGGATAADLEGLGEDVRRRVFETSGVTLSWEIRIIGHFEPLVPHLAHEINS